VKKIIKGIGSLGLTAASALLAGACYEHGRKIGKGEAKFSPEALGSTAHGFMTKVVMKVVEQRARLAAEQAAAKAKSRG
jgi:hypothetical protein